MRLDATVREYHVVPTQLVACTRTRYVPGVDEGPRRRPAVPQSVWAPGSDRGPRPDLA